MARLENPQRVHDLLESAGTMLSLAHKAASESEDGLTNLNGNVRDMLFGLNSSIEALRQMITEQYEIE